jgi:hypothetical protein
MGTPEGLCFRNDPSTVSELKEEIILTVRSVAKEMLVPNVHFYLRYAKDFHG